MAAKLRLGPSPYVVWLPIFPHFLQWASPFCRHCQLDDMARGCTANMHWFGYRFAIRRRHAGPALETTHCSKTRDRSACGSTVWNLYPGTLVGDQRRLCTETAERQCFTMGKGRPISGRSHAVSRGNGADVASFAIVTPCLLQWGINFDGTS